jgi:hypothetical protein
MMLLIVTINMARVSVIDSASSPNSNGKGTRAKSESTAVTVPLNQVHWQAKSFFASSSRVSLSRLILLARIRHPERCEESLWPSSHLRNYSGAGPLRFLPPVEMTIDSLSSSKQVP